MGADDLLHPEACDGVDRRVDVLITWVLPSTSVHWYLSAARSSRLELQPRWGLTLIAIKRRLSPGAADQLSREGDVLALLGANDLIGQLDKLLERDAPPGPDEWATLDRRRSWRAGEVRCWAVSSHRDDLPPLESGNSSPIPRLFGSRLPAVLAISPKLA